MRIPVLNFPWTCYICKRQMKVTYPLSEEVYKSDLKGNLGPTFSHTRQERLFGNRCPYCGGYQGNFYVENSFVVEFSQDLANYAVGFIDIKIQCLICGKELEEQKAVEDDSSWDLFSRLCSYNEYLGLKNCGPEFKQEEMKQYIEAGTQICQSCDDAMLEEKEQMLRQIEERSNQERLQQTRDGPLVQCPLCKKNTKETPETLFEEHHLSYYPEKKMLVCSKCHNAIHHTTHYPNLIPKDKFLLAKEIRALEQKEENARLAKDIALEVEKAKSKPEAVDYLREKYCIFCGKTFNGYESTKIYGDARFHQTCLNEKLGRRRS